ncbi:MAG TPA: hypothetical protein VLL76_03810 [Candidatus Omnitrophota bacterium]|nr:hypothetical protein [Candidatus Omnitrophota bacterium]
MSAALDTLRARIRAMERLKPPPPETVPVHPAIDSALPGGGLAPACLHQVLGADGPATAFAAAIAGRLAARLERPVLWVVTGDDPYGPGLGLPPDRLLVARARDDRQVLWSMEEALKCPDLACVVAEIGTLDLTAGRRLQLAAEAGGVTGLALHPPLARAANSGTTRWRVDWAPGGQWRVTLERCRNGAPGEWVAETLASITG